MFIAIYLGINFNQQEGACVDLSQGHFNNDNRLEVIQLIYYNRRVLNHEVIPNADNVSACQWLPTIITKLIYSVFLWNMIVSLESLASYDTKLRVGFIAHMP